MNARSITNALVKGLSWATGIQTEVPKRDPFKVNPFDLAKVLIKNGGTESVPLVKIIWLHLQRLMKEKPIVLYELVMLARDPEHELFGRSGEDLEKLGLILRLGSPNYRMLVEVRNIVLSATKGKELDIELVSPLV